MDDRRGPVFFTIVANNYLGFARTLMESVRAHHPASPRYVVLCDEAVTAAGFGGVATLLPARSLGIPGYDAMAFHYDVMEFATAIKPTAFLRLMERHPGAPAVYLDPDILVTAPLVHVTQALAEGASFVLTPHLGAPLQDGMLPDDLAIMKSGVFNLGFAATRAVPEALAFLRWWQARCRRDAVVDIPDHKFTDQRWVDMAPAFLRDLKILHHPGYNLAYWNLAHRTVTRRAGRTLVDGEPLRFVHFSGVSPEGRTVFSRHQNRFTPETIGDLRPLFEHYLGLLHANGWAEYRGIPYAYDRFAGGRRVHRLMRRAFRREEAAFGENPFAGNGEAFDAPDPDLSVHGPPTVTRLMAELWRERPDLQRLYDLDMAEGRHGFREWFVRGGAEEAGLGAEAAAAVRRLLAGEAEAAPAPPWKPQTGLRFEGARAGLDAWLGAPVPLLLPPEPGRPPPPVPRHLALAWEDRPDLRQHFRNGSVAELERFLAWGMTHGMREGEFDPPLAAPALGPWLDAEEAPATAAAPPVTRLLRLMVPAYEGPFADQLRTFPASDAARCVAALWVLRRPEGAEGWPSGACRRLTEWCRAAPAAPAGPLVNLFLAFWRLRNDVRAVCDLETLEGQMHLLAWAVGYGMREFGLPLSLLPGSVLGFLGRANGLVPEFRMFHRLWLAAHDELQQRFDIGTAAGQRSLAALLRDQRQDAWDAGHWIDLLPDSRPARARAPGAAETAPLLLTGLLGAASGRGEDVRMTVAALRSQGVPFATLDRRSGRYAGPDGQAAAPGRFAANIMHMNADSALRDRLFLHRSGAEAGHVIGYWAWELPELPAVWHSAFACYDEIWASTRFAAEAFRRASPVPVTLMPMPVALPETDPSLGRADFGLPEDSFVFYYGFDFRSYASRKNPEAALAAFRRAFPLGTEKATLLIKTLGGGEHDARLRALLAGAQGDKRVIVRDCEYPARTLATLIARCDSFLSLHRAEGFGRGPAEAMLLGKPVIATGWSGNTDFMDAENALLVDYRLVPVAEGAYPGWQGQHWAEPDVAHAAALMRRLAADAALAARLGARARAHMRTHYSPEVIGRRILARLAEIVPGLRPAPGTVLPRRRAARAAQPGAAQPRAGAGVLSG